MKYTCAVAAGFFGLTLLVGCASTKSASSDTTSNAAIRVDILLGVAQIRGSQDGRKLHGQLLRTLERLRGDRGSTAAGRKGRRLAIEGFASTLKGIDARLDFAENDSGNIEAAVRDAMRADRYLKRGANFLRAAARAVGVRIGKLNGY